MSEAPAFGVIILVIVVLLLIFRRFPKPSQNTGGARIAELEGAGDYGVEAVGESNYQKALSQICGGKRRQSAEHYCVAHLILEDSNPHDSNAVRIDIDAKTVGYLARASARAYRQTLAQNNANRVTGVAKAVIRGGWKDKKGEGDFGVWLDL